MSLGNGHKTQGNKGSNYDFELRVLRGLQELVTDMSSVEANLSAKARTPNMLRATGSGTIAPVVYSFSVSNVGAANGTILGQNIKPGETVNFDPGGINNYYTANTIAYNGTGTELLIIYNS
jgi:hypothetical protein